MNKSEIIQGILHPGILAIIRADSSDQLVSLAEALVEGGVSTMEITMTTPNALQVIGDVTKKFGSRILMGVGSVLDSETCRTAILAGADFVVTPVTKVDVIRVCNRYGKPIVSGAYSPTEALHGYESGADFIKIFPADQLGPNYIKNILAPMPMLQIIPTGGVTVDTAASFIDAGCAALAAGSRLVGKEALKNRDWKKITSTAAAFVEAVKSARSGKK